VPASYAEDDLAEGRAALLSGWSSGSEPGLVITRAAGALVWDAKGNEYIDCTSMAWSNNIGASVPEVVEAAFAQARQLSHLRSNFDSIPLLPDILVFGKGAGGGFPLAGVLASMALAGFQPGDEALTFGEFPVSLAAGRAALEVLKQDGLLQVCAEMGQYASDALHAMKPRHPLIGDIRGPGLLIGVELARDQKTKEPATSETLEVYRRAMDLGVIFGTTKYAGLGNVLQVKPPFTITRAQLDRVLDVLDQVLTAIENR
jgi:4-aminobutyrate aminotransferase-like enzyme